MAFWRTVAAARLCRAAYSFRGISIDGLLLDFKAVGVGGKFNEDVLIDRESGADKDGVTAARVNGDLDDLHGVSDLQKFAVVVENLVPVEVDEVLPALHDIILAGDALALVVLHFAGADGLADVVDEGVVVNADVGLFIDGVAKIELTHFYFLSCKWLFLTVSILYYASVVMSSGIAGFL